MGNSRDLSKAIFVFHWNVLLIHWLRTFFYLSLSWLDEDGESKFSIHAILYKDELNEKDVAYLKFRLQPAPTTDSDWVDF